MFIDLIYDEYPFLDKLTTNFKFAQNYYIETTETFNTNYLTTNNNILKISVGAPFKLLNTYGNNHLPMIKIDDYELEIDLDEPVRIEVEETEKLKEYIDILDNNEEAYTHNQVFEIIKEKYNL